MNIGEASRASGVNQKMIRYYESIGLLEDVGRSANGYRTYTANEIHTLAFIRRARHLGFPIQQIQTLMALWRDKARSSAEVKAIAQGHIGALQGKIEELASMQRTLEHLVACCAGDHRPDCPIIDDLSASVAAPATPKQEGSNGARQPTHLAMPGVATSTFASSLDSPGDAGAKAGGAHSAEHPGHAAEGGIDLRQWTRSTPC